MPTFFCLTKFNRCDKIKLGFSGSQSEHASRTSFSTFATRSARVAIATPCGASRGFASQNVVLAAPLYVKQTL